MSRTLAQKLVARAAGRTTVTPGEIVTCKVDLAMMHDSGGPRRVKPMLERLGAKVWDPSKVVVITDHYVPAHDDESRKIIRIAREWVREAGIENFYDEQGICHVVLPERGNSAPAEMPAAANWLAVKLILRVAANPAATTTFRVFKIAPVGLTTCTV